MTGLAADLLVLWAAATAVGTAVLLLVVLGQGAAALVHRAVRRRPRPGRRPVRAGLSRGAGPPAAR